MKQCTLIIILLLTTLMISCSKEPQPINFGVDSCNHCLMKISDERYGAELVTKKGKIYKFDDMYCMKAFIENETVNAEQIFSLWLVDFHQTKQLIEANKSFLLANPELKSPMGSNTAAFSSIENRQIQYNEHSGTLLLWQDYFK